MCRLADLPRSRMLAAKFHRACWRLSPLFHEGAQNFRVINFDHVDSLTAGCGSCRRQTERYLCLPAQDWRRSRLSSSVQASRRTNLFRIAIRVQLQRGSYPGPHLMQGSCAGLPIFPGHGGFAAKLRRACWRLSPLFYEGAQNFRVINFDHVGSLTAGCGSCRRQTERYLCLPAQDWQETQVSRARPGPPAPASLSGAGHPECVSSGLGWPGVRPAQVGVVFPKLSKLLNQEDALSAPCIP
jgi:hypothetical protein